MDISGVNNLNNVSTASVRSTVETQKITGDSIKIASNTLKNDTPYTEKDIDKAIDKFNKVAEDEGIFAHREEQAEYSYHDKLKQVMIKIVDKNTKEVLLEVPPKKILDMVAKMCEMVGILVDKKA